jgi:hypothetical protein
MDAQQDPVDQQIQELHELFDHLLRRYMALVANFQMLRPLLEDDQLRERLDDPSKRLGAGIIATALFNACVLDACVLLQSREGSRAGTDKYPNLALSDIIEPLVTETRALLDRLSKECSDRVAPSPSEYSKTMPPDVVQRLIEDDDRKRDASLCEFQAHLEAVKQGYPALADLRQTLATPRNKWIAHLDVHRDPATQSFVVPDMPDLKEQFVALENAVALIGRLVAQLASIVNGAEAPPEELEGWLREHVATFWDLEAFGQDRLTTPQRPMTPGSSDAPTNSAPPGDASRIKILDLPDVIGGGGQQR